VKKFSLALIALATALAISPAVLAGTLCPSAASTSGYGGDTFTNVSGPLDGSCGVNSAVTLYIPNDTSGYARLQWTPGNAGYPTGLSLGNLSGVNASVVFSADVPSDQPFYMLSFYAPNVSLGQTNPGDQILMLEFEPSGVISGSNMVLDPNATLFNLYDNDQGFYLNGANGQQDAHTLDYWLSVDPGLSGDSIAGIRIGIGMDGGCPVESACSETLTVDSADVTATPEPSSLFLLGTGLLGLAGILFRKEKASGHSSIS
jgi:hypothetical protein